MDAHSDHDATPETGHTRTTNQTHVAGCDTRRTNATVLGQINPHDGKQIRSRSCSLQKTPTKVVARKPSTSTGWRSYPVLYLPRERVATAKDLNLTVHISDQTSINIYLEGFQTRSGHLNTTQDEVE